MTEAQLADLSRLLYTPVSLVLLTVAMLAYLYGMSTRVTVEGGADRTDKGRKARVAGTILAVAGTVTLLAHMVTRSMASDRLPLGNMFEFSTFMAVTALIGGLVVVQWRMKRPELMGFIVLGAVLTMGLALLVYNDPGPLMPILDTWWRAIHVTTIALAAGVFTVAFVFSGLYLLRDTAERRVAALGAVRPAGGGSTVGAAAVTDLARDTTVPDEDVVDGRVSPDVDPDGEGTPGEAEARVRALRQAINPWKLAGGVWLAAASLSWVFWVQADSPARFFAVNTVFALAALLAWWFVPFVPDAATLDSFAYRSIAFGFPLWTFAVLTGAIWAEVSWGRYWGWDPKETSAFVTWIAYAAYLHARATRGMKGRPAGWLGLFGFYILMFTYFVVNLVINGLHTYAM